MYFGPESGGLTLAEIAKLAAASETIREAKP
jgi:hypothetical protein